MRHRKAGRKLNRNSPHRKAMIRNMVNSLVLHETITTTLPKAKELRRFAEKLVTVSRIDTIANRRNVFSKLRNDFIVGKLFTELGPFYENEKRPGGYIRILKCGFRMRDNAPMAIVQLVGRSGETNSIATNTATNAENA